MKHQGPRFRFGPHLGWGLLFLFALGAIGGLYQQVRSMYRDLQHQRLYPLGPPFVAPAPAPRRLVIFGDSRARAWPAPDLPGWQVVNRGRDGFTTAQNLARYERDVAPLQPDILLIQTGVNDLKTLPLFPGQEAALTQRCLAQIRALAHQARQDGALVILTTVFPPGPRVPLTRRPFWSPAVAAAIAQVNDSLLRLAGDSLLVLPAAHLLAGPGGTAVAPAYAADLLHLTPAGYARLDTALRELLTPHLQPKRDQGMVP